MNESSNECLISCVVSKRYSLILTVPNAATILPGSASPRGVLLGQKEPIDDSILTNIENMLWV